MSTQVNPFDRSQYPQDAVYTIKPTHHFNGEVTNSKTVSNQKKIEVDGALIIESVDDKTREAALRYFTNLKANAISSRDEVQTQFYKDIGITIVGAAATIGSFFIPVLIPAIAVAASGVGLAALGIRKGIVDRTLLNEIESDISTMKDQSGEWKDPAFNALAQRKNAGLLGFPYVYKNQLKGSIIHPEEVQQLWQQNFKLLLSVGQTIEQMCDENLLGSQTIEYAWGSNDLPGMHIHGRYFSPHDFKSLGLQFNTCRTGFQNFRSAINQELDALNREKKAIKQEINHLKTRWMLPAEYSYSQGKQTAQTLRQQALAPFLYERDAAINKVKRDYYYNVQNPLDAKEVAYKKNVDHLCEQDIRRINRQYDSHPAIISINQAYDRDIRMCNFLYTQSQLVVNAFFDQRIRRLEESYNRNQTKIEEQRTAGYLRFKHLMDQVLVNPGFSLSAQAMPIVQQNWSLPNLNSEPSWGEVYGNAPSFHSGFINDVSEYAWNHFWGANGLGHFASFPTSSWNNHNFERTTMPFANRYFNLHGIQHHAQPGMFMREACVPARPMRTPVGKREPTVNPCNPSPTPQPKGTTRTATGFGGTTRREPNVKPGERVPENGNTAGPSSSSTVGERVTPGTRAAKGTTRPVNAFATSSRR